MASIAPPVQGLDSPTLDERLKALDDLRSGEGIAPARTDNVNMHCHSFFSYNAHGWSPSRIAWELSRHGVRAAGICEFDVLDGMAEFFQVGERLALRTAVHLETRCIVREYADKEIDSPGEPGVSYVVGGGFARLPAEDTKEWDTLAKLRARARQRNLDLVDRINLQLPEIAIDYDRDVVSLTPSGNATERHIVTAYLRASRQRLPGWEAWSTYWSPILRLKEEEVEALADEGSQLDERVRKALVKQGGLGYVQPSKDTFPAVDEVFSWVRACGGIPMDSWLDGTSQGEQEYETLLECMREKGAVALNLIPDRNWNIQDPSIKALKYANFERVVRHANDLDMPIMIGTELNKPGLPIVDDLSGEALAPFKEIFVDGASILVGHTIAVRFADFSYAGDEADAEFSGDTKRKNRWFASLGKLPPLTSATARTLERRSTERNHSVLHDSVRKGAWSN